MAQTKVLVVEDNDMWRQMLTLFIRRAGHEVFEAATGRAGVDEAAAVHPDLILMDLGLPEMSGDEATAALKANPATRDIPVVIQTAYISGARTRRALSAGAAEILYKPVDLEQVEEVLRKYLAPRQTAWCPATRSATQVGGLKV